MGQQRPHSGAVSGPSPAAARRGAAFVCAAALVTPDGAEHVLERRWRGAVARGPRGTHGFGYDPLFLSDDLRRTLAEVTTEEKAGVSHRGRAFAALLRALADGDGAGDAGAARPGR